MQSVGSSGVKGKEREVIAYSDISSDEDDRYSGPVLTMLEHRVLDLLGELQSCGVKSDVIISALEGLRYSPRIMDRATPLTEEFLAEDVDKVVERDKTGLPVVGVFQRGERVLTLETLDGESLGFPIAKYLTCAYKVLAYMLGHFPHVQVVMLHWQVFSRPAQLAAAMKRTSNARKRKLVTTLKANDSGGFNLSDKVYPPVVCFDHETVVNLMKNNIGFTEFSSVEVRRLVGLVAHMYHYVPVIMSEERPGLSERVSKPPMPMPPSANAPNIHFQHYARYFHDNYFVHGICDPLMFFTVVLRDYILDSKILVVREYLRDTSPLYKMYKRVLTMAINSQVEELRSVALMFQGIKLSQVAGMQEMKYHLTAEMYADN
jgi:hypothetical protein